MGWLNVPGPGNIHKGPVQNLIFGVASSAPTVDATGEKFAFLGPVHWSDGAAHNIQSIGFVTGPITSTSNSVITLSLQNVATTNSTTPYQPDEIIDQSVDFNINTLTSSGWFTKTLTATRSVLEGENIAVVWEFNSGGRLGSDSLRIGGYDVPSQGKGNTGGSLKTAGTWGIQAANPDIIFTADDGNVGSFVYTPIAQSSTVTSYNKDSVADELAIGVKFPFKCRISGVGIHMVSSTADFDVVLYSGTTVMATVSFDGNAISTAVSQRYTHAQFSTPQELEANTLYRIALKPTTTSSVSLVTFNVNTVSHLDFWLGQDFHFWSRVDGGAWGSETDTRVPLIQPIVSQIFFDDSASATDTGPFIGGLMLMGVGR